MVNDGRLYLLLLGLDVLDDYFLEVPGGLAEATGAVVPDAQVHEGAQVLLRRHDEVPRRATLKLLREKAKRGFHDRKFYQI